MAEMTDQELNDHMDDYEQVSIFDKDNEVWPAITSNDGSETNSHSSVPTSSLRGPEMFVYRILWL